MKHLILAFLLLVVIPAHAAWVKPYVRKNGTLVSGHITTPHHHASTRALSHAHRNPYPATLHTHHPRIRHTHR